MRGCVFRVDHQRVFEALEVNRFCPWHRFRVLPWVLYHSATVAFLCMFSMIWRQAYARVVGAEGDFALLRGVGNDAHFRCDGSRN